ncbi:MAG: hypothetical protein ACKPFD_10795, partial [Dolichospermum sp.]
LYLDGSNPFRASRFVEQRISRHIALRLTVRVSIFSPFPIPHSPFPIPYSPFPIPHSLFPVPCSL